MLASKVMFAIIEEFLDDPTAEALESLATLLTVIGPTYDVPEWPNRVMLVKIFDRVQEICRKPDTKSRVRCLLQDVLDLREASWNDRKPQKLEGMPSTLDQVAQKFHAETAALDAGQFRRSFQQERSQSGFRGTSDTPTGGSGCVNRLASDLFAPMGLATPKSDEVKMKEKLPQASKDRFDKEVCRKELTGTLAELRLSHDVKEAVERVVALAVPSSQQPEQLCEFLGRVAEEGSDAVRKAGFATIVSLFEGGHWTAAALGNGLQMFTEDLCADLKCDVPTLPRILNEELRPALEPLVKSGLLTQSHVKAFGRI
jgi:hypothetical protein